MQTWVEKVILFVWCGFSYVFLLSPMVVVMGASLHGGEFSAAIKFPPEDPSFQWYSKIPMQQFEALGLSLIVAAVATFLAALIAVPAALGLVRSNFKGKFIVTTIFRAPLQIPAIVSGIAFLQFYYLIYDNSSLMLAGTIPGMLIGHVFIATPFLFGTIVAVLQRFDHRLEEAAHSLGAGKWRTPLQGHDPDNNARHIFRWIICFHGVFCRRANVDLFNSAWVRDLSGRTFLRA